MSLAIDTPTIFDENFLLFSDTAQSLYHEYAKALPIIDYHNHLPPTEIANDKKFNNLTEIWLKGDHYKWRAMRAYGVEEKFITGDATDEVKFKKWAEVVPFTLRNPLFHWTHMELKYPFGIDEYLDKDSAPKIYSKCNELLQQDSFSTRSLLEGYHVEMLGTTDDPCDDLHQHRQLKKEWSEVAVLPSFRPDKILKIADVENWSVYIDQKDGMEKQLNVLSNMGLISTFIGMLTDSRSFLSYSRHEYFRRILCNLFASEMLDGILPNDLNWVGNIIKDICYGNVKKFLNFDKAIHKTNPNLHVDP